MKTVVHVENDEVNATTEDMKTTRNANNTNIPNLLDALEMKKAIWITIYRDFEDFEWDVKNTMVSAFASFKNGAFKYMMDNYDLTPGKCLLALLASPVLDTREKRAVLGVRLDMWKIFAMLDDKGGTSRKEIQNKIKPALEKWSAVVAADIFERGGVPIGSNADKVAIKMRDDHNAGKKKDSHDDNTGIGASAIEELEHSPENVNVHTLKVHTLNVHNINAHTIQVNKIKADNVNLQPTQPETVDFPDDDAFALRVRSLDAHTVKAYVVTAHTINAHTINAKVVCARAEEDE
ncbi:hypothetical protein H2200_011759 [Cladophialophora chaetospira]|uniref:Uncharacterized protein n=1 Tax=Cladophialophora chaetospira TaxID=386627 RepID=A0AA38WYQ2_9EURO|nr:hypothetical protein H2200_011759 [Cladophialophora chaetospira]